MKKVWVRTREQAMRIAEELMDDLELTNAGLMLEWEEYQHPHTRKQQKKFHVMCRDLALFTGDLEQNFKDQAKHTDIWPKEERIHTVWKDVDGKQMPFKRKTMDPKSEADLSKEEEAIIIDLLFMWGDSLPGFTWSNPAERNPCN